MLYTRDVKLFPKRAPTLQEAARPRPAQQRSTLSSLYPGNPYQLQTTYGNLPANEIGADYPGLAIGAFRGNGIAFACMEARRALFAEATFSWRQKGFGADRRPGPLFGNQDLSVLEHPWQGASTINLLSRAIQDVDLDGNFYAVYRGGELRRVRPDWVRIVVDNGATSAAKLAGYRYTPMGDVSQAEDFLPEEVLHWAPVPDPAFRFRGMSWLTPVIRELCGDSAMTDFKTAFFENGATPNMVVEAGDFTSPDAFNTWVAKFKDGHEGSDNAHKTLYLANGAKATVVGADLQGIDLRNVQGAVEMRISAASGVPALLVGVSADVNATYANYLQARRKFADHTMRPLWRSFCAAAEQVILPPAGAELWYDDRRIDFLQEDVQDAANIKKANAAALRTLLDAGFTPESAVKAVEADDNSLLVHSGLFSVQLQKPTTDAAAPADTGDAAPWPSST